MNHTVYIMITAMKLKNMLQHVLQFRQYSIVVIYKQEQKLVSAQCETRWV
jgi:hypothetical protein